MNKEHLEIWKKEKGDYTYRLDYKLNEKSIVFDVGGYKGWFTQQIHSKYKCNVYIFEPVLEYYQNIEKMFKGIPNIKSYPYGLSYKNDKVDIYFNDDSSSVYRNYKDKGKLQTITLKCIKDFIAENKINHIDILKLNIEGEEYPILDYIIENNLHLKIDNIQVQFHQWIENSVEKRNKIRDQLSKTHTLTYDFEFIWENWKLK